VCVCGCVDVCVGGWVGVSRQASCVTASHSLVTRHTQVIDTTFDVAAGPEGLLAALKEVCAQAQVRADARGARACDETVWQQRVAQASPAVRAACACALQLPVRVAPARATPATSARARVTASGARRTPHALAPLPQAAISSGFSFIVLSDRSFGPGRVPLPSLLATGAVHHHLVGLKIRSRVGLLVETGEVSAVACVRARVRARVCLLRGACVPAWCVAARRGGAQRAVEGLRTCSRGGSSGCTASCCWSIVVSGVGEGGSLAREACCDCTGLRWRWQLQGGVCGGE
jgi:hypothetical protein